jgi:hypothetical protein
MAESTIRSPDEASLFSLVRSAASAATGAEHRPVGRLIIVELAADEQPKVALEATVSAHGLGWKIEQLDLNWHAPSIEPMKPEVVRALLEQFGSNKYTNLTIADVAGEIADLTLSFSSRVPFWGQLLTIARPDLALEQGTILSEVLGALGITATPSSISQRKQLLRAPPSSAAQAQAFALAARAGFRVELYTAALPATHAVRIAQDWVAGSVPNVQLCISYGLSGHSPPSAEDERRTQAFLRDNFALQLANKSWQVTNAHGAEDDFRPHVVVPQRRKTTWSVNWGRR